jgi:vanillate O-demethylase monooxygenase subunit
MIEAVQSMMGTPDLDALSPVLLTSDAAAVRARRMMKSLIETEREKSPAVVATITPV